MSTKDKTIFWVTVILIVIAVVAGLFFAVRRSIAPAAPSDTSGIEFKSLSEAEKDPMAVFRLNLKYDGLPVSKPVSTSSMLAALESSTVWAKVSSTVLGSSTILDGLVAQAGAASTGSVQALTTIPPAIFTMTNMTLLSLTNNALTSVPPEIGNLKNLQALYLNSNELTSIPDAICTLSHMTLLSLYYNKIASLPSCVAGMTNLKILGLTQNPISASMVAALRNKMPNTKIIF